MGNNLPMIKGYQELSKEETVSVEIKVTLAASIRRRRVRKKFTQSELAEILKSSQSHVAKNRSGRFWG